MHRQWEEEAAHLKACIKARLLGEPELAPRMGRFRLVRFLGQGTTGIVYEAQDTASREMVALKLLRTRDALGLYRFKQEFRALCGVMHENLVQLYELFAEGEQWCFTMELVQGADFEAHVRGDAPVGMSSERPQLRPALIQLISAVQAIHAAGKLHCDLKPSNVRVARDGRVVVLDFGSSIAGTVVDDARAAAHVFDPHGGTRGYVAPEVVAGALPTPASDAYSIGAMLFQALTGELPFDAAAETGLVRKQSPRALRGPSRDRAVPEDLDALCRDLLEFDPTRRCSLDAALERLGVLGERRDISPPPRPAALSDPSEVGVPRSQRLVGRDAEFAQLHAALEAAPKDRPILLLVRGPSGIGKSALAEDFVAHRQHEAIVLRGRCYERESTPFKAFDEIVDALARYLKTRPPDELRRLAPLDAQALFRVFPTLSQVPELECKPERAVPASAHEWRQRAFGALKELLRNLTQTQPLVMFADDLQWADLDSARLLMELMGPPAAPAFVYVGCHRSEDEDSSAFLREIRNLEGVIAAHERHVLTLGPIEPSAAAQMALELMRDRIPDAQLAAQRVGAEASGLPFAVRELSRYLLSELAGADDALSLAGVLKRRVAALSSQARWALSLLALAKGPLPAEVLRHAFAGEPNWQQGLRALQVEGFVRGDALGSFVIDHDRLREQITVLLSGAESADLHRVLAKACEQVEHVEPERLVEHWRGAGDATRALSYALSAAELSTQKLAFNRAADLYRLALQLLDTEDHRYGRLQQDLGDALANAGRSPEAAGAFMAASVSAEREPAFSLRCRAMQQYLRGGEISSGTGLARELFARAGLRWPESRPALLFALVCAHASVVVRSFWSRAGGFRDAGRRPPSAPAAQPSPNTPAVAMTKTKAESRLQVLRATFQEYVVADALRGVLLQSQLHAEALRARDAQALFAGRAWHAYNVAAWRGRRGRRGSAKRIAALEAMAAQLRSPYVDATTAFMRAAIALWEGRYADVEAEVVPAIEVFRSQCVGATWEESLCSTVRYAGLEVCGPVSRLRDDVPAMQRRAIERGDHFTDGLLTFAVALVQLAQDQPDTARAVLDEQLARLVAPPVWTNMLLLHRTIDYLLYLGRGVDVWKFCETVYWPAYLKSGYAHFELTRSVAHSLRARCALSANAEQHDARYEAAARREGERLRAMKRPESSVIADAAIATLAFARGELASARVHMERAWRSARDQRMALYALCCRRQLGRIMGGGAGGEVVAEVDAALRAQGVARPARWIEMYVPGFAHADRSGTEG